MRLLNIVSRLQQERFDERLVTDILLTVLQQQQLQDRLGTLLERDNMINFKFILYSLPHQSNSVSEQLLLEAVIANSHLTTTANSIMSDVNNCGQLIYQQLAVLHNLRGQYTIAVQC